MGLAVLCIVDVVDVVVVAEDDVVAVALFVVGSVAVIFINVVLVVLIGVIVNEDTGDEANKKGVSLVIKDHIFFADMIFLRDVQ